MIDNTASTAEVGGLVIITGNGPEHRYVANRIIEQHPVRAILVCDPAPRRSWRRILRRAPLQFLDKALWRLFLKCVGDASARDKALLEVFGPVSTSFNLDRVIPAGRARSGILEQTVRELAPDVLAIYGTSLIPDSVLTLPRKIALNMHTGISPRYRGTGCAFWPIHNCEPDWVGATVHECTAAVDGGRIFATRRATLYRNDSLHHIFARAVLAGADTYAGVLEKVMKAQNPLGQPQTLQDGREYRGNERGLRSELVARRNLRRLHRNWPKARLAAPTPRP
mgnify:CR=1 FL=1